MHAHTYMLEQSYKLAGEVYRTHTCLLSLTHTHTRTRTHTCLQGQMLAWSGGYSCHEIRGDESAYDHGALAGGDRGTASGVTVKVQGEEHHWHLAHTVYCI